jgi:hypothetical protein
MLKIIIIIIAKIPCKKNGNLLPFLTQREEKGLQFSIEDTVRW